MVRCFAVMALALVAGCAFPPMIDAPPTRIARPVAMGDDPDEGHDRCRHGRRPTPETGPTPPAIRLAYAEAPAQLPPGPAPAAAPAPDAAGPAVESAKINTDDAGTVEPGRFEIRARYDFTAAGNSFNSGSDLVGRGVRHDHVFTFEVKYGVTDTLDAGVAGGFANLRDDAFSFDGVAPGPFSGTSATDPSVFVKWRFYEDADAELGVAYVPGFTFPAGRRTNRRDLGAGAGSFSFDQLLVATRTIGRWSISADAGFSLPFGDRRGHHGTFRADVAAGFQIFDWLQKEVEINFAHGFFAGSDSDSLAVTFGLLFPVQDWRFEVAVQQVVFGRNADLATTVTAAILRKI